MDIRSHLAVAGTLLLASMQPHIARASDCGESLVVAGSDLASIPVFDRNGKDLGKVDKALALKQRVLECDETYGLVKVALTDGRTVWMDRGNTVRVADATQEIICTKKPPAQVTDSNVTASNASGPQRENCVPQAPNKP